MAQVLDIAPLRSLVAVADCGGFHRAAAALHLSQSAVSQHLRKVESVVGEPVVQRSGRGVLLTETGQKVLRHARTILAAHDAALDDLGATEHKVLTVGATEHGADVMLPALTSVLRERLPDRRPRFRLDRNVSLADAIDRGLVDLAIMLDGSGLDRANASGIVQLQWVSARTFTVRRGDPLPLVIYRRTVHLARAGLRAAGKTRHRLRDRRRMRRSGRALRGGAVRARIGAAAEDRQVARRVVPGRGTADGQQRLDIGSRPLRHRSGAAEHRRRCGTRRAGRRKVNADFTNPRRGRSRRPARGSRHGLRPG